jgi:ribosomal RNA-processing protein 1
MGLPPHYRNIIKLEMTKKVKDRKQKERRPIEPVQKDGQGGGLARALASTDGYTRERGLQALTMWLKGHKNVNEKDLLRLWKALFYCFWHSDKAPVQASLDCIYISGVDTSNILE